MSRPLDQDELNEWRQKIEALHCSVCESEPEFCKWCIYQSCREAFDFMAKHMIQTDQYYERDRLRYFKTE
jgi:hypothetical protein